MSFERVVIGDVPVLCLSEAGEPTRAAPVAFERLESALPSLKGRRFYGIFDPGTTVYRACVAERDGDIPETWGLARDVIPGGAYLRARLRGAIEETTAQIGDMFAKMAQAGSPDDARLAVEFYRREDELDLLFPIKS